MIKFWFILYHLCIQSQLNMNSFTIKLIAFSTMIIDHIGLFFFPNIILLRIIGRLSFPLFAWLIANGASKTHSIKKYLLRILCLALVSQIPFTLANRFIDPNFSSLNVVFTLFLGLISVAFIQRFRNKLVWFLAITFLSIAASLLRVDYGPFGVILIATYYIFRNNIKHLLFAQIFIFAFFNLLMGYNGFLSIETFGIVSLLFIVLYNGKQGVRAKNIFYFFYPIQYIIIYLILIKFLHL